MDETVAKFLPNPISIAGSTLTVVLNRIHIEPKENVAVFLKSLETEQRYLTAYAHAPIESILAQLNPSDAAAFKVAKRQLLNWGPHTLGAAAREAKAELQLVQIEGHGDAILIWHCGMLDAQTARLIVQWDVCQAGKAEVEGWTTAFMKILQWLGAGSPGSAHLGGAHSSVRWERTFRDAKPLRFVWGSHPNLSTSLSTALPSLL